MGLNINIGPVLPGMEFNCFKCKVYCDGKNSKEIKGGNVLRKCPKCGHEEIREKDTLDTLNTGALLSGCFTDMNTVIRRK